jgi:hypothetical protein
MITHRRQVALRLKRVLRTEVARAMHINDRCCRPRRAACWRHCIAVALAGLIAAPALALTAPAAALRAQHDALREALRSSSFQRPLVLQSTHSADDLKGEVYAVVEQPFAVTARALSDKGRWCDVLILHLNVKDCRAGAADEPLRMVLGRKFDRASDGGQSMAFTFSVPQSGPDYLRVQMAADAGPLSTRDHRLTLEVAPLDARSSFIHLTYGYAFGTMARWATQAYLSTAGRDKVGFTVVRHAADGTPVYIDGVRGMVERNVMRYYLAVEAYLGALSVPAHQQHDKRLRDWFAATERNAMQLREMGRDEYLAMKRQDAQRVQ